MSIILDSGTPRDVCDRSNALATDDRHQDRVYPFGSNAPPNLTIVDVEYDPAIKVVAPLRCASRPNPTALAGNRNEHRLTAQQKS